MSDFLATICLGHLSRLLRAAAAAAGGWLGPALLASAAVAASPSAGAKAVAAPPSAGADVSYPQCAKALPRGQRFAVVGVNGGLANNANPCLRAQLRWGSRTPGLAQAHLASLSLYIDAADPGPAASDWPSPAKGTGGASTPYGNCDATWTTACAYRYGVQRASYSYALAAAAPVSSAAWWIDAQKSESWATARSTPVWAILNIAALQGFTTGLRGSGARGPVGFYSDAAQWGAITFQGARTSRLYFPLSQPDWVVGAGPAGRARAGCAQSFTGARVLLAQFSQSGHHEDLACTRTVAHRRGSEPSSAFTATAPMRAPRR